MQPNDTIIPMYCIHTHNNAAMIIIHVGTNNLCDNKSARKCANEVIDLASTISRQSACTVAISRIVYRSGSLKLADKI